MVARESLHAERNRTLKIIKKFLNLILALVMLLCVAILVCAFNPSLTNALAAKVSGNENTQGPIDGDSDMQISDESGTDASETQGSAGGINIQTGTGVYVPPAQEDVVSPESVKDMTGYDPIWEENREIADEDAKDLQDKLKTGDVGEEFEFDSLFYPYYGMLDSDMKALYRQIYANALECNTSFAPVVEVSVDEVKNVFEAVYNDHPELFWLETGYSCKHLKNGKCIELTLQYYKIAEDLEESRKQFEAAAEEILNGAEELSNDAEKEKYVHDALIKKVDYHAGTAMGQSAYSALVSGRSVCAGYARAFQYLMMELGIPCYYCAGYSGENHAWNIVKLDDGYYNVDVTWDDTDPSTYDYFNKTDADYSRTHLRKGMSVKLPVCTGKKYRIGGSENSEPVVEEAESVGDSMVNESEEAPAEMTDDQASDLKNINADDLINNNPQKPLEWIDPNFGDEDDTREAFLRELEELGLKEEDILDNLDEYYADCLAQMKKAGTGQQQFTNVIPKALWQSIERVYSDGSYEKGYVDSALKELKMENFAIQLQTERLSGGKYYRLYHNISTW